MSTTTTGEKPIHPGPTYERVDEELTADKSTIIQNDNAPVTDPVSSAALLRSTIETTSRLLVSEFRAGLQFCHSHLATGNRLNQEIDLLSTGEKEAYTLADYDASLEFTYAIGQKPFTESYALVLSGLQFDELHNNRHVIPVPKIPRLVWRKITTENPWIFPYLDLAGEVFKQTSNLLHGNSPSPVWTLQDLDIALSSSTFSDVAQTGLREYLAAHESMDKFIRR
ncbi:hypothetical protein C8F04DRAFT_1105134 [Mycena alexandri]|uniref:Uncharacterized protein n=1 Tax=Mycena alexandri TaxID=1745969 RepID=A0AAD6X2B5_9AGAR|nr:hypothetical protein C8F04DRAFT_1105134 [Mycena alexandri]